MASGLVGVVSSDVTRKACLLTNRQWAWQLFVLCAMWPERPGYRPRRSNGHDRRQVSRQVNDRAAKPASELARTG